jgi:hypothetical protein
MSDELDPELLRLFAEARQDLPGVDFQARLTEELHQRRGVFGIAGIFASTISAVLSGVAQGVAAPFGIRHRHVGLMAVSGAAVMLWLSLQMS